MKKNILTVIFLTLSFVFLLPGSAEAVRCDYNECAYTRCDSPTCDECPWCTSPPSQEAKENIEGKIYNPFLPLNLSTLTGTSFLQKFLRLGISLVFLVGAIVFFFMLVSGGIKWISSGSDKAGLEGAQKQITHALVGLAILLSAFAIIKLIETLFGVSLLNLTLPTL